MTSTDSEYELGLDEIDPADIGQTYTSLLETRVEELGALLLHERRTNALSRENRSQLSAALEFLDGVSAIPEMSRYEETRTVESKFSRECEDVLRSVVQRTRKKNPQAIVWDKGEQLPVLLFGGGAHLSAYQDAVHGLKGFGVRKDGLRLISLAVPEELRVSPQEYARLAVAYGLSFLDIGEVSVVPWPVKADSGHMDRSAEWLNEVVGVV